MNSSSAQFKLACDDLFLSLRRYRIWLYLGWSDIQQRYRGSLLGPLWITLSMVIFIGALSIVYSRLFHTTINNLLPYLTTGMLGWIFVSTVIIESTEIFFGAKSYIDNMKLPYFIYIFRLVWRNLIVFFHNMIVFVIVAIIFGIDLSWNILWFLPGLALVLMMLISICTSVSLLGTRFRDLPPLISSFIMVVFFVSPVTWQANMIGHNSLIVKLNPVVYFLDIIRSPLLGQAPMIESWIVCGAITIIALMISFSLFARFRSRIAFWI